MDPIRILIADDHPLLLAGLCAHLEAQPDMTVVAQVADGPAAVSMALELVPDVAVLELAMPLLSGAETTERILAARPSIGVLIFSALEDAAHVRQAMRSGARGYVVKRAVPADLMRAIRAVAAGNVHLDPAIEAYASDLDAVDADRGSLSEREAEVIKRIARGHPMKEIAASLRVSVRTIETYRARAMEKLGLQTRADLIRVAVDRGWLHAV